MPMNNVFLPLGIQLPQLLGGKNAVTFEDTREGEQNNGSGGWRRVQ
jgi:hypothetical protein